MIYGIGLDIVELQRMGTAWRKFGNRLAQRILHPEEWQSFQDDARPAIFLAKRWAAKEAVAKAFGSGLREGLYMRNICIRHSSKGQPLILCEGAAAEWLQQHQAYCHISLSDERHLVCAVAVLATSAMQ
ncbi:MAG: holo-ACP synthase [Candidatus Porifericomitaceae bacterium WSBS_2022_MAG_OTU9]